MSASSQRDADDKTENPDDYSIDSDVNFRETDRSSQDLGGIDILFIHSEPTKNQNNYWPPLPCMYSHPPQPRNICLLI